MATIRFTKQLPTIEKITRQLINEALKRSGGDSRTAAKMLGISAQSLGKHLKKWQVVTKQMIVICLLVLACGFAEAAENQGYVEGQVVVNFKPEADMDAIAGLIDDHGLTVHEKIEKIHYYVLTLPKGASVTKMAAELRRHPLVKTCEPNYTSETQEKPNDEFFPRQWSLSNYETEGADLQITKAWEVESGNENIIVAVIDMGFDLTHEDLQENIWHNHGEIADNGIDDDQNGYVDDVVGWDFVHQPVGLNDPNNDYQDEDNDPTFLLSSHGNRVLGVIGATTGNGIGIAGIAGKCKIMLIRAGYMNTDGSSALSSSHIAKGVIYAVDNGAKVINISSGSNRYSNSYKAALEYAVSKGALVVCSAGNEGSGALVYPAAYDIPGLISVGASSRQDKKSWFSNYGNWVDVSAPGENIISTLTSNNYGETQGTSFAAPMVAAVAALIFAHYPDLTPVQVKDQIMNTVDTVADLHEANITSGRVNAYQALTATPSSNQTITRQATANTASAPAPAAEGGSGGGCFIASSTDFPPSAGIVWLVIGSLGLIGIRPMVKR